MTTVKSVGMDQHAILADIMRLHAPDGFEVDVTYGNGGLYKGGIPQPVHKFDIDPQAEGVICRDSQYTGLPNGETGSVIYDPPFLTYIRKGRDGNGHMALAKRFGGYWSYDELQEDYIHSISEAYRILKKKGVYVIKCQDIIHNHKMHCTHGMVINMAEVEGFRLLDLFILHKAHRMRSPQKGQQRHARIHHSYFLVFKK